MKANGIARRFSGVLPAQQRSDKAWFSVTVWKNVKDSKGWLQDADRLVNGNPASRTKRVNFFQ